MRRLFPVLLITFLILPLTWVNRVTAGETVIEAEKLEYVKQTHIYYLRGHVKIKTSRGVLTAESVDYNEKTGDTYAWGGVRFDDGESVIEGEELKLNLNTQKGTIKDADILIKKDNYHIRAESIEKYDQKGYRLRETSFTTCDAPLPEWCFVAQTADLKVEDRLKARKVRFKIKGVPILYSPYFWAPVGSDRKSGLLLPEVGFRSNKGFHWRQPLYIVLAPNRDMTLYLDYFSRRGIGEGVEYRYIERTLGEGTWYLFHQHDRKLGKDFVEFQGRHTLFNKEGFSAIADISLVNRKEFLEEYKHRVEERVSRYLESTFELSHTLSGGRVYLFGRAWQDMSSHEETGDLSQKVPELGIRVYPTRIGRFYFSLNADYTYFYSENLWRTHRLDIHPEILFDSGDHIRITHKLGLRETLYNFSNTDTYLDNLSRETLQYGIRLHSGLKKLYGRLLHVIEPEISYTFIPETDELPLFDRTELFDRVSLLEIGIKNRFFYDEKELLSLRLSEGYDFHEGDRPFGDIRLEAALLSPFPLRLDTSYNPNTGELKRLNYSLGLRISGIGISLSQRYVKDDDILSYTAGTDIPITRSFSIQSSVWYNAKGEGLQDLVLRGIYRGQCWGLTVAFNKRPDDYGIFFMIELKGLGAIRLTGL